MQNEAKNAAKEPLHEAKPLPLQQGAQAHDACEKKYAELNDKYLRISAEFDNYKKRTAKEKEALSLQSEFRLMLRLLPAYEGLKLAENAVSKIADKPTRDGALLAVSKLCRAFESDGLEPMKLHGEKLDPYRHEVAMREPSDAPEGEIVRVISQGYLYKGEVLRHAIVSISAGKAEKGGEKEEAAKKGKVDAKADGEKDGSADGGAKPEGKKGMESQ